jgi:hypothetical protein
MMLMQLARCIQVDNYVDYVFSSFAISFMHAILIRIAHFLASPTTRIRSTYQLKQ